MEIQKMREKLDRFCDAQNSCYEGCPLHTDQFRCGRGTSFLDEGPKGMPDENIIEAYDIVFRGPTIYPGAEAAEAEPMRHFSTGAVRDSAVGKGRYDLMPWGAVHALAQHCERGALHYGERNVDKGIPQHSLIDSGLRHLSEYIQGDAEDYHLVAALWNIAWACEQELKRPEMIDLPERTEASGRAV